MQLSASDRRTIIEDLLDIQIFSTMNGILRDKVAMNKDETVENKHQIEMANTSYAMQEKHIRQLRQNNDDKVKEYEAEILSNNGTLQSLHGTIGTIQEEIDILQGQVSSKAQLETKLKEISKIESKVESNLSKFRKDISFFEQNDHCPTCRQTITLEVKEKEIEALQGKVGECEHGLQQIESKLLEEQSKLNAMVEIQKQIQQLNIQIATNNTTINETNKYIGKLQKQIETLQGTQENLDEQIGKLDELKQQLHNLETRKKELIEEKSYSDAASILLKDTGIKTKIIKQ